MATRFVYLLVALLVGGVSIFFSRSTVPEAVLPSHFPGRNNTVLFLSDAHAGLANVLIATSHALLLNYPDLELHYGSFPKVEKRITAISAFAKQEKQFHALVGKTYAESMNEVGFDIESAIQPPGIRGIGSLCGNVQDYLMPWTARDYLTIYHDILRIMDEIDPVIVVVDPLFGPALDAIRTQGRNHATPSPNNPKDNSASTQPRGSTFWNLSSGYPYPVPWHLIPANIYLNIRFIYSVLNTPRLVEKKAYLKEHGIAKPLDVFSIYQKEYTWLSSTIPEAEFPFPVIPSNVVTCGPIYRSDAPAEKQDKELAKWLGRAPTVLINLGSTVNYDEFAARELVSAIKSLLSNSTMQVLWKFNKRGEYSDEVFDAVSTELKDGRLRLEKWLSIDPAAILETGNIVASVYYGGANCYFEALAVGIPQIVLPLRVDLYDYATRVEYLGIGVFGSPESAPKWTSQELTRAFARVLDGGEESVRMKEKAASLGEVARKAGGRYRAAEEISKLARIKVE